MTDPTRQRVSETAKCGARIKESDPTSKGCTLAGGHDSLRHEHWRDGQMVAVWMDPKYFKAEPAEPVAVPPAPPEIPADLKADYRDCANWHNGSYIKGLIERIAALEGKRA